jgi:membrane-bound lytic murein transglycosylase B
LILSFQPQVIPGHWFRRGVHVVSSGNDNFDTLTATLHVADPELLKKHQLKKGDQVSVEVDTNNNIIQIAKPTTKTN